MVPEASVAVSPGLLNVVTAPALFVSMISVTLSGFPSTSLSLANTSTTVGTPVITVAASATEVMLLVIILMVVLPFAVSAPPVPWAPVFPSSKVQLICTLAGGVLLLLL